MARSSRIGWVAPGTRVDQLVRDVDALRNHLGLERMDLFGHSASGGTRLLYASAYAHRMDHLVLVSPSLTRQSG
jgi:pimeloyl-ACP methyl ester carboxylesterase